MKLLIEVPDYLGHSLLEVLSSMRKVKVKQISNLKACVLLELREALEEVKLIEAGKKKSHAAREFLEDI